MNVATFSYPYGATYDFSIRSRSASAAASWTLGSLVGPALTVSISLSSSGSLTLPMFWLFVGWIDALSTRNR